MTDKVDRNMQDPAEAGHDDVNVRAVMLTAAVLAVVTVVVYVVVYLLFWHFESREARRTPRLFPLASDQPRLPPAPRLQPDPAQDLKALRQRDEELLTTYGWVNEKTGIVRIPIDRAMKLLLERGVPVRSTQTGESASAMRARAARGPARDTRSK